MTDPDPWPLRHLELHTPRRSLRPDDDDGLRELAALATRGIHPAEQMPFSVPWTDQEPVDLARGVMQHHWTARGAVTPQRWSLHFLVRRDGAVAGTQTLSATEFPVIREVSSGSWVGRAHQGDGIGTEMRAAVLAFAFDHLGALQRVRRQHRLTKDQPQARLPRRRYRHGDAPGYARHRVPVAAAAGELPTATVDARSRRSGRLPLDARRRLGTAATENRLSEVARRERVTTGRVARAVTGREPALALHGRVVAERLRVHLPAAELGLDVVSSERPVGAPPPSRESRKNTSMPTRPSPPPPTATPRPDGRLPRTSLTWEVSNRALSLNRRGPPHRSVRSRQ